MLGDEIVIIFSVFFSPSFSFQLFINPIILQFEKYLSRYYFFWEKGKVFFALLLYKKISAWERKIYYEKLVRFELKGISLL